MNIRYLNKISTIYHGTVKIYDPKRSSNNTLSTKFSRMYLLKSQKKSVFELETKDIENVVLLTYKLDNKPVQWVQYRKGCQFSFIRNDCRSYNRYSQTEQTAKPKQCVANSCCLPLEQSLSIEVESVYYVTTPGWTRIMIQGVSISVRWKVTYNETSIEAYQSCFWVHFVTFSVIYIQASVSW